MKKKIIIIGAIVLALTLIITTVILFNKNSKKLSEIEEIKLKEVSKDLENYLYNLEGNNYSPTEKNIFFTLDYKYNEEDKDKLKAEEIKEFVESKINTTLEVNELNSIGVSPNMLEKNISFDHMENEFFMNKKNTTMAQIAETPIYKYQLNDMKKKNRTTFVLTYTKYKINDPYEILNYYNDINNEYTNNSNVVGEDGTIVQVETDFEPYDTDIILNYLKGNEKVSVLSVYLTEDLLKAKAEDKGTITITYILKDGKILLDKIES